MTDDTRLEEVLNEEDESGKGGVHTMCDVLDRIEARVEARGEIRGGNQGSRSSLS